MTSIRHPVMATVLSIVPVVFGLVAIFALGVREYPAVDPPIVTVNTVYAGASPEVIDSVITEPLERAINGVAGIRVLSRTSRTGQSSIRVELSLGSDLSEADADASPIIFLTLRSEPRDTQSLSDIADRMIRDSVQTTPAWPACASSASAAMRCASCSIQTSSASTTSPPTMCRRPSRTRTSSTRRLGRGRADRDRPPRRRQLAHSRGVQSHGAPHARWPHGAPRGRGTCAAPAENQKTGIKSLGIPMVGFAVVPQPNSNAVAIADELYHRLDAIRQVVPADCKVEIGYGFTTFMRTSLSEVEDTLLVAFMLVAFIIMAFLRDWRATLIPVIAIPVSIVSTFFIMFVAGFSINVLTLVGLVLATTVVLAAVFVPVVFLQGLTGRLFRELGIVVAGSVLASAFVALTLSPMMGTSVAPQARPSGLAVSRPSPSSAA